MSVTHLINRSGIIPARAGFTRSGTCARGRGSDHPRSRGVYGSGRPERNLGRGSSPLARGLPAVAHLGQDAWRIIPARAGFTQIKEGDLIVCRDHPRSRGVYAAIPRMAARIVGSSPLARGLRVIFGTGNWFSRIIPARAGFTSRILVRRRRMKDHPRSRGVYAIDASLRPARLGSSPLARGLPRQYYWRAVCYRIIPARAGFTSRVVVRESSPEDHPRSRGVYADFRVA